MKNTIKVALSFLAICTLAGCSDAVTKVKNSSDILISVGGEKLSKGSLYSFMKQSSGASTVNSLALKKISEKEVPVDDSMKKKAQETLANYKNLYGDSFSAYLKKTGMTEEKYISKYLIPSQQAQKLNEKYINENYDSIVKKYQPVQASVLSFTNDKDAQAALKDLKAGKTDLAAVAKAHHANNTLIKKIFTLNSKEIDALVRNAVESQEVKIGWTSVTSSDGASFNLVKVDSKDEKALKSAIMEVFKKDDTINSDSTTYFFKKYHFHVYDKVIYDALKSDYPQSLVQGTK